MIDLKFDCVSKKYRIRHESDEVQAGNGFIRKFRGLIPTTEDFWAVKDVSFDVKNGETLGIIGHNGAGKSTILKLLASITSPTKGNITINGRLSALIEVGSGFHPELTGRENIYLNGSILGMRRSEITRKLDSIVEFAGLSQFLDTPVKRFSSGMYVRLGFSIAAHLDPDILLLDEVLAVGDASFQAKCLERINELKLGGTTIVFISHDLGAIEQICDRVLLMDHGQVAGEGTSHEMIQMYQQGVKNDTDKSSLAGNDKDELTASLEFLNESNERTFEGRTGSPLSLALELTLDEEVKDAIVEILVYTPDQTAKCQFTTDIKDDRLSLPRGRSVIKFESSQLPLLPGIYLTDVYVRNRGLGDEKMHKYRIANLKVLPGKPTKGEFFPPQDWTAELSVQ